MTEGPIITIETTPRLQAQELALEFAEQGVEAQAAGLVSDLHRPNPRIFWADQGSED